MKDEIWAAAGYRLHVWGWWEWTHRCPGLRGKGLREAWLWAWDLARSQSNRVSWFLSPRYLHGAGKEMGSGWQPAALGLSLQRQSPKDIQQMVEMKKRLQSSLTAALKDFLDPWQVSYMFLPPPPTAQAIAKVQSHHGSRCKWDYLTGWRAWKNQELAHPGDLDSGGREVGVDAGSALGGLSSVKVTSQHPLAVSLPVLTMMLLTPGTHPTRETPGPSK